jgi:hypothetical protein
LVIANKIPVVILNACESAREIDGGGNLAKTLACKGVPIVIGMAFEISVESAVTYASRFYSSFLSGDPFYTSAWKARSALRNNKERDGRYLRKVEIDDWIAPVIFSGKFVQIELLGVSRSKLQQLQPSTSQNLQLYGRDVDILEIETLLLDRKRILVLDGLAGIGKSYFLKYLSVWWQSTGFIKGTVHVDLQNGVTKLNDTVLSFDLPDQVRSALK